MAVAGTPEGSHTVIRFGFVGLSAMLVSRCACVPCTSTGGAHVGVGKVEGVPSGTLAAPQFAPKHARAHTS